MANGVRSEPTILGRRIEGAAERPPMVEIVVDGGTLSACPGESVAAALLVAGRWALRTSPRLGLPRGVFCLMGACQECLVQVEGRRALACQTPVRAGMRIETAEGAGEPL